MYIAKRQENTLIVKTSKNIKMMFFDNPMSDGGVQEIADFEEGLREFLFEENKYQEPYKRVRPKVGANELCPCGSGKKFKKCCRGNGKYD